MVEGQDRRQNNSGQRNFQRRQDRKSSGPANQTGDNPSVNKRPWRWFLRKIKAWDPYSAFITAVATAVIAAFTISLYCVSHRQWKTMEQQLETAERGWVGITDITVTKGYIRDTKPKTVEINGTLTVRNFGPRPILHSVTLSTLSTDPDLEKTCATVDKVCDSAWIFATAQAPKNVGLSFKRPVGVVIFPDKDYLASMDAAADLPTSRPFPMVVTGCSVYFDQFKRRHYTKFCYIATSDGQNIDKWHPCNSCQEAN